VIRSGAEVPDGFTHRADVCVIGSGAGGGVAAALLAEGGRDVFVLEEGPRVPREQMTQREEEMYPLLYRDGGDQATADGGVSVLQGRALGGSTVINMADVVDIPAPVLEHWRRRFGVTRYSDSDVAGAAREAREAIGANRIPLAQVNRNGQRLLAGGARLGIRGGAFDHNRTNCVGSGYCLVGCAYDAKRSVALTFIPRALATGRAIVQTEARVDRLVWERGRVVAALGHVIDRDRHNRVASFRVDADTFVLAAGAIHSPLILQASGLGGRQVGRNLSLQPQAPMVALFDEEIVAFRGVPQAAYLDGFERINPREGLAGFRLESISGTPGMSASISAGSPAEVHAFMARYQHFAACLCLAPDRPGGRVTRRRDGRPKIAYRFQGAWVREIRRAMACAARVYLEAGARAVMPPVTGAAPITRPSEVEAIARMPIRPATLPLISAHPQGTCRMSASARRGVVGLDMRLHGAPNLRVLDASIFPTTSSSHTMLPVMSFAVLGAREMLG